MEFWKTGRPTQGRGCDDESPTSPPLELLKVRGVGGSGGGCKGGEAVWVCQRGWCIVHSRW